MSRLEEIIAKARQLPLLSHTAMQLLEIIGDKDHSLMDLTKIIETDPALTAKTLELVNSAAFSLMQQISTVGDALPYIGEKIIVSFAMKMASPQVFNRPLFGYESKKGELWAHSLRTGLAASELAPMAKTDVNAGVAFTAGILHDIGKSVLSKFLTGASPEILRRIDEGQYQDFLEAEESATGANHCTIGGELAKHWNLPSQLRSAIQFHHLPQHAEPLHRSLTYVVHLADALAMMGGTGTGADNLGYRLDKRYTDHVAIDTKGIDNLLLNVMLEFEQIRKTLFGEDKEETDS